MRVKVFLYIVFLVIPAVGLSQNSSWQDSIRETARLFFSKVDKIELVKLKPYCDTAKIKDPDSGEVVEVLEYCREESIIRNKYFIDTSFIGERYLLDPNEIDALFDMLYVGELSFRAASCYNPRHGIVFYNSPGGIIGFLEICFECNRMYGLPDTPNMGPLKGEPFKKLQRLFEEKNLTESDE